MISLKALYQPSEAVCYDYPHCAHEEAGLREDWPLAPSCTASGKDAASVNVPGMRKWWSVRVLLFFDAPWRKKLAALLPEKGAPCTQHKPRAWQSRAGGNLAGRQEVSRQAHNGRKS